MQVQSQTHRRQLRPSKYVVAALLVLYPALSNAQTSQNPVGTWVAKDGSSTVRIAPCGDRDTYCATVIQERLNPGDPSNIGSIVVRDLKLSRKKGWLGKYMADGTSYPASAKFRGKTEVAFKVCAFAFLCDTQVFVKK